MNGSEVFLSCTIPAGAEGFPDEYMYLWFNDQGWSKIMTSNNLSFVAKDEGFDGKYFCCPSNIAGRAPCGISTVYVSGKSITNKITFVHMYTYMYVISVFCSCFLMLTSAKLASLAGRQAARAAFLALVRSNGASTYSPSHTGLMGQAPQPTLPLTLSPRVKLSPPGQASQPTLSLSVCLTLSSLGTGALTYAHSNT